MFAVTLFINTKNWEIILTSFNWGMNKQTVTHPSNGTLLGNKRNE